MSQLILDFGPPPAAGFDNFVAGRNSECLATLRALKLHLRDGSAPPHRFIYIWGPAGTGKSHLAAALGAQQLTGLAVVDDCQALAPDEQRGLFHRFDAMAQAPDQVLVVFGDAPPARLPLMPELASRLAWGIVFALEPLADSDLIDALGRVTRERGLALGEELPAYLLTHTRRDMGSLKGILDRLDRISLEQQRPVSLPMLRSLLRDGTPSTAGSTPTDRIT